ncbi:short chain dehydrogenase, partial [gamma proteobacterium HTCC5015]
MSKYANKVALITGAGSGIGRETAYQLAEHGAHIILVDLNEEGLKATVKGIEEVGRSCEWHVANVARRSDMNSLARKVNKAHGALDILVNNAGIGSAGVFMETSLDTWDTVIDVNVKGVVHGCHYFLPAMVERGGGHVVNLASAAAFAAPKDMPIYCTSKFAVLGFTESLRAEMAGHGIGVSAICPGLINTPIVSSTVYEGKLAEGGRARDKAVALYKKRNYPPEKVAASILHAIDKNKGVVP